MPKRHELYTLSVAYPDDYYHPDGYEMPDFEPEAFTKAMQDPSFRDGYVKNYGDTAFRFPSSSHVYRDKRSALTRAALLENYGCTVQIIVYTPSRILPDEGRALAVMA